MLQQWHEMAHRTISQRGFFASTVGVYAEGFCKFETKAMTHWDFLTFSFFLKPYTIYRRFETKAMTQWDFFAFSFFLKPYTIYDLIKFKYTGSKLHLPNQFVRVTRHGLLRLDNKFVLILKLKIATTNDHDTIHKDSKVSITMLATDSI